MSAIKNVAIAGASGSLGSVVFKTLVESGKFNIRVLKREGSSSTFPAGTDVVEVDYSSPDSLKAALKGQDALISTLTTLAIDSQLAMIDAAIEAGVKRLIPSEFGSNLDVPRNRVLPVFTQKVKIQDYIIEKSKSTPITYTFVYNAAFLDWGLEKNFLLDLSSTSPALFNGGTSEFSATTLSSVGDALVGILTHPEETKNRAVKISDIFVTQKRLLELAQQVAPEKSFKPVNVSIADLVAKSEERLAKHLYDMETFAPYLFKSLFEPEGQAKFVENDNELLGVKGKTEDDIIEILKPLLK